MGIIRFLLALAVVASHSTPILGLKMIDGPDAVEIFFIISGFYMSLILRGKYAQHANATQLFYGNRFLRLYPTYLLCILLTWAVFLGEYLLLHHPPTNSWMELYHVMSWKEKLPLIFANWTMIGTDLPRLFHYRVGQGFIWFAQSGILPLPDGSPGGGFCLTLPQAWTVGLEIWFYLMAPFILRRSWWLLAGVLVASVACKAFFEHVWHYSTYYFFPAQCCYFIVGALLQRAYESWRVAEWPRPAGQISLLFILIGVYLQGYFHNKPFKYAFYSAFCLALPMIFAYTRHSVIDRHLGNLSYPIYLLHLPMQGIVQSGLKLRGGDVLALFTIAGALGIYVCMEIPIDSYRQSLLHRRSLAPEPAAT